MNEIVFVGQIEFLNYLESAWKNEKRSEVVLALAIIRRIPG